jgi:hypothetical protein
MLPISNGHVKPTALTVRPENIPEVLRRMPTWVVWKLDPEKDPETGEVHWNKRPYNARTHLPADVTDLGDGSRFLDALDALQRGGYAGLGLCLHATPEEAEVIVAIDLDKVRNLDTEELEPWALEVARGLNSYTEVSPSGRGLRILCLGRLPPGRRRKGGFECYERCRYVTITGHVLMDYHPAVENRQAELVAIHSKMFPPSTPLANDGRPAPSPYSLSDLEVIEKASAAANGEKFKRLWAGDFSGYGSRSERDLALCNLLAFWCQGCADRIDELFRGSGCFRSKWANREDYATRTIAKAVADCHEFYTPGGNGHRPEKNAVSVPTLGVGTETAFLEGLKVIPFSKLKAADKADAWHWHGYLGPGVVTLLSALFKAGKTTLLAHALKAMDKGGDFLGLKLKPCRVLYITEEHERKWAARRDALGIGDHCHAVIRPFQRKPKVSEWLAFLKALKAVQEREKYDIIVFDTLSNLWPVKDENAAPEVQAALMPLHSVIGEAALLLVHHLRKSDGTEGTGSRGSGAIGSWVDILVELRRYAPGDRKDRRRVLTAYGRFEETTDELVIALDDKGHYAAQGDKAAVRGQEVLDVLSRLITTAPGVTLAIIRDNWPGEHCPRKDTLLAALEQGVAEKRWQRAGDGKKGSPYRYLKVATAAPENAVSVPIPRVGTETESADAA